MLRRTLLTGLVFALAACGGNTNIPTPPEPSPPGTTPPTEPAPPAEPPAGPTTFDLAGTASGYTGAAGTVRGYMFNSNAELATGTVATGGAFNIALPSTVDGASLADSETFSFCPDNPVSVSPAGWQADVLTLEAVQSGAVAGNFVLSNLAEYTGAESPVGLKQVSFIYSAAALTVTGDCPGSELRGTVTYNYQLQPGWNYAVNEVTTDDGAGTSTTVSEIPTDVSWSFLPPTGTLAAERLGWLPNWALQRR